MDSTTRRLMMGAAGAVSPAYVEDVFSTWLYTGNGSTQTITNGIDLAGKGGLVWLKDRSNANGHFLTDSARGVNSQLRTHSTAAATTGTDFITALNASGFTLGSNGNVNGTETEVSWTFRKAPKFFDAVTYTGNGGTQTISHNLGSTPGCIIVKCTSTIMNWNVYHRSLGNSYFSVLNSTNAPIGPGATVWGSTDPTSTAFTVASSLTSSGETFVAYVFAHDAGGFGNSGNDSVIKCGNFVEPSSGTVSVNLGWEPQYLMIKPTNTTGAWYIFDNMRTFNYSSNNFLLANGNDPENTGSDGYVIPTSTGFTLKSVFLGSGTDYIYIAIRRGPMKTPTDATKVFVPEAVTPSTGNSFTTGFPVDLSIANSRTAGQIGYFQDRLRGYPTVSSTAGNYPLLVSTNTNSESDYNNTSPYIYASDSNTSVKYGSNLGGLSNVTYAFRRAPGFFDVVAYTGTGVSIVVNHNLGVTPELIIGKCRSSSSFNWIVYHKDLGTSKYIALNSSAGSVSSSLVSAVSATTFTGEANAMSSSGNTHITYLFSTLSGVSKVGSYTGTGTTLQINCGFTAGARFVMIKRTDSTGDWYVWDSARGIVSGNDPYLLLNSTAAEVTGTDYVDTLSAGFEISSTAPAAINANGGSFLFLAIA
jgi:hypothetical protein